MTTANSKPAILCVDDEPGVLEGLELHLRRGFRVHTATSGAQGLQMIDSHGPFAVVLSDMRMPEMSGAVFLSKVREKSPASTRMLLTGQTDMQSAIQAVNEGQIFRFLTKPCPPKQLKAVFEDAVELHNLKRVERDLLERTLRGSIKALTDVLALVNPTAFGRAGRVRTLVAELCQSLAMTDTWAVEVASMVLQLGTITVGPRVAEKLYYGRPLDPEEAEQADRMPQAIAELLGEIPRLEPVLDLVSEHFLSASAGRRPESLGAQLLSLANDFDVVQSTGLPTSEAINTLRGRGTRYDPALLNRLSDLRGAAEGGQVIREVRLAGLVAGMIFAEDVRMLTGVLLAPRGYEVTESFVARAPSFSDSGVHEPVRVIVPTTEASPAAVPTSAPAGMTA